MRAALTATLLTAALTAAAVASAEDDLTSLSYISYLERYATVQPASQEEHLEALANMPLAGGDRVDTAREARVEIQLADGSTAWLDEYSSLSLDSIAFSRDSRSDRTVLFLAEGELMLEIPAQAMSEQNTRVDGPSATVYLNRDGLYRVGALEGGGLRLDVLGGLAEVSTASGEVQVSAGTTADVSGGQVTTAELGSAVEDDFSLWVEQRRRPASGESTEHVGLRYARQASQLDNYGSWVYLDDYSSWAWRPSVDSAWRPYTLGNWYWTPAGWSWLSHEPWGWLPYHYGSWWYDVSFGWVWSWGNSWGPAWVNWVYWPGHVGWCPAGYYDWWWWGNYGYWYGWHDWDDWHGGHDGHDGHGGSGHPQPPRGDVVPRPRRDSVMPAVRNGQPIEPTRLSLDLHGGVSVRRIDPAAWNVIRSEDFASPHLSRLVQPGEVALRNAPDVEGVVTSGPLVTDSPAREAPRVALDRVFQRVDRSATPDLSPVLARQGDLEPAAAMRLVEPTTTDRVSRRSPTVSAPAAAPSAVRSAASEAAAAEPSLRRVTPNIHRSTIAPNGASAEGVRSVQPRPAVGAEPSAPPVRSTSAPRPSFDRSSIAPAPRSSSGSVSRPAPRSQPSTVAPRGSAGQPRSSYSSSSSSRPVIIPNSSPSRPSRQLVRPSPSYAPSSRAPSSSPSSRPSAPPASRAPSSGGSHSSPAPSGSSHASPAPSGSSHATPSHPSSPRR